MKTYAHRATVFLLVLGTLIAAIVEALAGDMMAVLLGIISALLMSFLIPPEEFLFLSFVLVAIFTTVSWLVGMSYGVDAWEIPLFGALLILFGTIAYCYGRQRER